MSVHPGQADPQDVIVVEGLVKEYGSLRAVDGLSLTVRRGEVFALLGPNGAGKTTTVEILEGHRRRTAGQVRVLGMDPATGGRAFRERIGIVLQEAGFDEEFSVTELLDMYASMYPRQRDVGQLIELVGLGEKAKARTKTLSGGQRRRLDLALGLVGDPEVLFLDEPTTGFDPSARRRAWELVASLRDLGTTILLTTHYMEEAEVLADRVAVIRSGRVVAQGAPGELVRASGTDAVISFTLPESVDLDALPAIGHGPWHRAGSVAQTRSADVPRDLHALTEWALAQALPLDGLATTRPSLEDVYLELIQAADDA